jgi:integrase
VRTHKTVAKIKRPLVIPISVQLRRVLEDARRRAPGKFVITYRGRPVATIRGGLKAAALAAGVPYGRFIENGVTFHTLRHTAATILAELDVSESKRKSVMGHEHLGTTQKYTHLRPVHELPPLEQLSAALPLTDLVTLPWTRATRKPPVKKTDQQGVTADAIGRRKPSDPATPRVRAIAR